MADDAGTTGVAPDVLDKAKKIVKESNGAITLDDALAALQHQQGNQGNTQYPGNYVFWNYQGALTGYPGMRTLVPAHQGEHTGTATTAEDVRGGEGRYTGGQADTRAPNRLGFDDASMKLQNWFENNPNEYARVRKEMVDAGLIAADASFSQVQNVWDQAVLMAYNGGKYLHSTLSPEDYILRQRASAQAKQPTSWTQTDTTTTVHNPADIQAAFQGVAQDALGRRATPTEAAAAAAAVGPSTSTRKTTTRYDAQGRTLGSNATVQEGIGAGAINEQLLQQAMQNPEYGAYQAAGHYFPLLLQALGAVNQAGAP